MKKLINLTLSIFLGLSVGAFASEDMTQEKCKILLIKSFEENDRESLDLFLNDRINCKEFFTDEEINEFVVALIILSILLNN